MNGSKVALFVAAALGLVAAAMNWVYLDSKSKQFEKIEFLSVATGATILPGDRFTEDKLAPLAIPRDNVRPELFAQAIKWADRQTVIGMTAVYPFEGGKIILRQDLKTPPPTMELTREDERGLPIPVDTRTFVPSLVNPGDMVSFVIGGAVPLPAPQSSDGDETDSSSPPAPTPAMARNQRIETIGPFRVLSIGNRLGSAEVQKASGLSQLQENVMTIAVRMQGDQLEPKAARLLTLIQMGGGRQAGVLLHPRTNK